MAGEGAKGFGKHRSLPALPVTVGNGSNDVSSRGENIIVIKISQYQLANKLLLLKFSSTCCWDKLFSCPKMELDSLHGYKTA